MRSCRMTKEILANRGRMNDDLRMSDLYSVKRNGKNGVAFYETKMNVKME